MKHNRLLFPALALLTCGAAFADDGLVMKVTQGEDNIQSVTVASGDILKFSDTEMKLMSEDAEKASFALQQIQTISFESPSSVGILTDDAIRPLRNPVGDTLEIACPPEKYGALRVCALNGTLMLRADAWKGEPVDVSSLSTGIYLVTVNNSTFKIIKK